MDPDPQSIKLAPKKYQNKLKKLSTKIVIFASISELTQRTKQTLKIKDKKFLYDSEMLTLSTPF